MTKKKEEKSLRGRKGKKERGKGLRNKKRSLNKTGENGRKSTRKKQSKESTGNYRENGYNVLIRHVGNRYTLNI